MQQMGQRLCIAKSRQPGYEIYGPFDLEIHRVAGQLFVVDAARLFPPEFRGGRRPGPRQYYELLRPELLRMCNAPLVSDALRQDDAVASSDLKAVSDVITLETRTLAVELQQGMHWELNSRASLKRLMHARGLNMRHLKELLAALPNSCDVVRNRLAQLSAAKLPDDVMDVKAVWFMRSAGLQ
jgi:hypothetical protein